jgi:hypothetical protein
MIAIRHACLNLFQLETSKRSLKRQRNKAACMMRFEPRFYFVKYFNAIAPLLTGQ